MKSKPEKSEVNHPTVVSGAEWPVADKELLIKEKESTRTKNLIAKKRLTLTPWRLIAGTAILVSIVVMPGHAQIAAQYPPLTDYLMPRDAEIALAKSAAPANISGRATVKVLTASGYQVASEGDNGFVCMVMRGWSAPTYTPAQFRDFVYDAKIRAPICFDSGASRTVMPYYELRSKLGIEGKNPDQIAEGVQAAYVKGKLPRRDGVSFAYMWSADQNLGTGIGAWHPHMMVFAPYYQNSMVGGNEFGSPFPQVSDDAGTPFTVVVIPVDHTLAVKAQPK
jgi:hypothetical protein